VSAATLVHAGGTPAATADLVSVYSLCALTPRRPKLLWRFARLTLFGVPESWFQNKNPADKRSFSAGEQHPDGERARHMANAKGKPLTTSTRSVMGMLTAQAA